MWSWTNKTSIRFSTLTCTSIIKRYRVASRTTCGTRCCKIYLKNRKNDFGFLITIKLMQSSITLQLLFLLSAHAFIFKIAPGQKKCFLEEVTDQTLVIGYHELLSKLPSERASVIITVLDPQNQLILTKPTKQEEGRFTFTSTEGGKHQICFATSYSSWTSNEVLRYRLRTKSGFDLDLNDAVKQTHVDSLKDSLNSFLNKLGEF